MIKKVCPLTELGVSQSNTGWANGNPSKEIIDTCLYHCPYPFCIYDKECQPIKLRSDKVTEKVYKCLSCKDVMTLYFEDEKLEEVKEVVPREYRGSRKLITKPAGKYTQEGGEIFHRHLDGLKLCREIKRRGQ